MRELTAMQAACWFGRDAHAQLGGVSAHLYAEFAGHKLDVARLEQALQRLYELHPMLAVRITGDGQQQLATPAAVLEVDDWQTLGQLASERELQHKRERWSHQQLDLANGQGARFSLSLLSDERFRLHLDTDMVAIDPSSLRILIEDLARLYLQPDVTLPAPADYLSWLDKWRADPELRSRREHDRRWWRERLEQVAEAPKLPFQPTPAEQAQSHRFSHWLNAAQRQALQLQARQQRVSLSNLLLGVFALALAEQCGQRQFRLNVPTFWRAPLLPGIERTVGEFANVLILSVDLEHANTVAELCQQLARQMVDLLAHSSYSGVSLMRDLSRWHGTPQLAPVVFTAALDLPGGELFSGHVTEAFGQLNWLMSQGPQVAIDAQSALSDGGILLNWDTRLDALPLPWLSELFARYRDLLVAVAQDGQPLNQPLPASAGKPRRVEQPLNALQQAYLLGRRSDHVLGGVAMQEFREYHGQIEPALLQARLQTMVKRHPSLRRRIDPERLVQWVSDEAEVNFEQIDLNHLSLPEALAELQRRRDDYAHALFDFSRSPWNISCFSLPDDSVRVFARFDALIVDGRSIGALLLELLDGVVEPELPPVEAAVPEQLAEQRKSASRYWRSKLQGLRPGPRLPWRVALEQIQQSRYARLSQVVPRAQFVALTKLGARQQLFKNSVVMALALEVLSHWLSEGDLLVAVPVAPPPSAALANHSSFIALNWARSDAEFIQRAAALQVDVMQGLEHLAFSGVDLARLLYDGQNPGPVFPVVITNGLSWPAASASSPMQWVDGLTQTPQVALDLRFSATAQGDLRVEIDYAREALDGQIVSAILQSFAASVAAITSHADLALAAQPALTNEHYRFNSQAQAASQEDFLGRIAGHIFDPNNQRIALVQGSRQLTYAALGDSVKRMLGGLQALGLQAGEVVAICLPRSPEHSMLTLACALGGLVWVPIDAASPSERLHYLLDNCQPALVVSAQAPAFNHRHSTPAALLAHAPRTELATDFSALSRSEAPAYYLYTSGTTGKPKCVVLNNRATANVLGSTLAQWQVSAEDVLISVTPLHHDMSVFDVLGSFVAGAKLVLPGPGEDKDAQRWNQLISEHQVSLWCSVPAILEMLLACRNQHSWQSLRLFAQGGDYIKPALISQLHQLCPQARLISLGGPTETTIWSIWHEIDPSEPGNVPYGRPLPGNSYYLLNEHGAHCPVGVVGRIHTAGVNLALGYLQDGALSQTDFVTIKTERGEPVRAFRTGDCGRYRADGTLLFDSRVNGYVKVRGVRVSLPDIEMALSTQPDLKQVLVVDYPEATSGDNLLGVLYVPQPGQSLSQAQLRQMARSQLPQSHVPARFIEVAELPLSQNGKPDRHRARSLLTQSQPTQPVSAAPTSTPTARNAKAQQVLAIYLQVLGASSDDTAQDFISLGLRPQHLKTIAARLQEAFAVALTPGQLLPCRNAHEVEQLLGVA
ncbi:amino acid adenylation domain-containing protein [Pseudomonas sp. 5P_3.1_Bac2]|uniref:amino acid adenylation domain-containing protein n=1 Tax=Pseudomonas sp. 5P_3.1_Bac2 TaxID=2971617 RepID=UPI0021C76F31|nr:amino acid adenylation domain-containing protein [Pseudomonas sp. 5P_3.1_Bac2]MCU1717156.1 amino acid adenylation domain-containing protein [Pseudomonas sp. 5P_3.1_Bac2]